MKIMDLFRCRHCSTTYIMHILQVHRIWILLSDYQRIMFLNVRFCITALLGVAFLISVRLDGQSATEVVRKAYNHERGTSSFAELSVQVVRPKWTRELSLKVWSQGNDLAMVLVTAPARERGVVYLKRKKEVWNWIPSSVPIPGRKVWLPQASWAQQFLPRIFSHSNGPFRVGLANPLPYWMPFHLILSTRPKITPPSCSRASAVIWGIM